MAQQDVGALFDAYATPVYRYLYRRLTGAADPVAEAEDLTAEVFVIAWSKRTDIPVDAPLPWLYAVSRRVLANHRRKRTDIPVADLGVGLLDLGALDEIDDSDPAELVTDDLALKGAWARLGPRDREILRLSAWEGLSGADLAAALGIGVGGAGAALSRARSRLNEELLAEG